MSTTWNTKTAAAQNTNDKITVNFDQEEIEECRELARGRNSSYSNDYDHEGAVKAANENGLDITVRGIMAELALEKLYDEASLDREFYEHGDGGVDTELRLDGELLSCDVKAAKWSPPYLKMEIGAAERSPADAFINAFVDIDERKVVFYGWLTKDEFVSQEHERKGYHGNHYNYEVKDNSKLNEMPEPSLRQKEKSQKTTKQSKFTFIE